MKRKNILIGAALGVVLALTGCSASPPQVIGDESVTTGADPSEFVYGTGWYATGDGRSVWCLYFGAHRGYSCDWVNAK